MTDTKGATSLLAALDRLAERSETARFWLRDDDAVEPSEALDRLLSLGRRYRVPMTLAVIPAFTGEALAQRLQSEPDVRVAVHGWSHENHAGADEKKQELGLHRPVAEVLQTLLQGRALLASLYGRRFAPLLVPPWNRIAPPVIAGLPLLGFTALSTFGVEKPSVLPMLNTHVDVMDWHGTRGGRPHDALFSEMAARVSAVGGAAATGLLTHHLVHDASVWDFLESLFAMTETHPGCRWMAAGDLIDLPSGA